jgi:adenylate cyclase
MPWALSFRYGTENYPPRVARRLQVLNATAWCGAVFVAIFALYDFFEPRLGSLAIINTLLALFLFSLPLSHRFGELAGPLAYVTVVYASIFLICSMLGTDSGMQLQYAAVAAGSVLVIGTERVLLVAVVCAVAVALAIALEFLVPHDTGLLTPREMRENFIICVVGTSFILFLIVFYAVREMTRAEAIAEREFKRSEALLANILPAPVVSRLKAQSETIIADAYDDVSILFADIAGSTARASDMPPAEFVRFLNELFSIFDHLVEQHGLEKIKTSGDGYMVVSGAPMPRPDHAAALASLALALRDATRALIDPSGDPVSIRIGLASGPVVAGVIGTRKFFYDVWGDAVNVASRMETTGVSGMIQVSDDVYGRLKDAFEFEERGATEVKGKGVMQTWYLVRRKAPGGP